MDTLRTLLAIFLLILGAGYPMFAIWRLSLRINEKERTQNSAQMIVQFVLIAAVPLAAMLAGFALLLPSLWESPVIRIIIYGATGLAIGALIAQYWLGRSDANAPDSQP
ncbi:MAG: hypothetical protein HC802_18300 [Caldilineaceae bacterium]|nr:hypothetical protein [Caldilineaceae bacterium]